MYIARLQLKGFKSFGGTHDLPLSPGMTAIVGPNGSGKSNLLDALRWVLGDSHASKLRVAKQGGLIFHGSASREAASEGEVGIQMRDGSRVCTIRRRVTDAGAMVTVDGARVTLTELDDVKRRWQLSGDRFAFIGQGEVIEVIQQKPTARRMLLESLFGIDAYRKRRDEASSQLARARDEYAQVRALAAELDARRAEIAPLVERAEAAKALIDLLEDDRRLMYWVRRARSERMMRDSEGLVRAAEETEARRAAWRAAWERAVALADERLEQLASSRRDRMRELDDARSTLANISRSAYTAGASLNASLRRAEQASSERAGAEQRLEQLRAEQSRAAADDAKLRRDIGELEIQLATAEDTYSAVREELEAARLAREERTKLIGEAEGDMQALKSRMKAVAESLRSVQQDAAARAPSGKDDPVKMIKRELDELEARHEKLLDEQQAAASAHRDAYAQLQQAQSDLTKARRDASRAVSSLAELREQASTEIYPRAVQHVLSASRLGRIKIKPEAVLDAFTCGEELAAAMEAFLGGRQFWLLVDTMDDASECIELLKKNRMGRATFLPLERSRPRRPDLSARLPISGVVGWACELIDVQQKWRPAIEHIMGDLLITETYDVARDLVRAGFRGPIATLGGDVFQPGGTISGGLAQKPGKTMELKAALAKLEAEASAAREASEKLSASVVKLEAEELAANERKDAIAAELRELSSRRSELDASRSEIMRERERARSERESMLAALKSGAAEYAELARRRRALAEEADSDPSVAEDESLPREIERLKGSLAIMQEKMRSSLVLGERMATEIRTAEASLAELDAEARRCASEIIAARTDLASLAARYADAARRRREAASRTDDFADLYDRLTRSKERRTKRREAASAAETASSSALADERRRAADLERESAELIQTWEERWPYPGEGAFDDADPEALRRSIRERERQVRALGDVDMGVLSEDRNLRERLSYYGSQLDDVRDAMASLERMISDADEQARTMFTNALAEIDKKFGELFRKLFTGGDAKLEMIEGASLWDSGVDVVARPPGKRPQSIESLSGGEQSLSAIALLFASLQAADCPIAVLDEVDAALDEVNLRRFADLTKEESARRQIFVMTHRRVTMERADTLYGVTLAEPGLSQVIGVRMEDWS